MWHFCAPKIAPEYLRSSCAVLWFIKPKMSSTSKESEDDLLAEEAGEEGEEDKESLTDERNAVLPRASQQLKSPNPASSDEINLLTNAILGLTKSLPNLLPPPRGETKGKGKRPASKSPNAVPAKKGKRQRWRGGKLHERLRPVH